jgi:hypothetical protein
LGKDKKKKKKYEMDDLIEAGTYEGMEEGIKQGVADALKAAGKEDMIKDVLEGLEEEGYHLKDDKESEQKRE